MLKLEQLEPGLVVKGLLSNKTVKILYIQHSGNSATVTYEYEGEQGIELSRLRTHM